MGTKCRQCWIKARIPPVTFATSLPACPAAIALLIACEINSPRVESSTHQTAVSVSGPAGRLAVQQNTSSTIQRSERTVTSCSTLPPYVEHGDPANMVAASCDQSQPSTLHTTLSTSVTRASVPVDTCIPHLPAAIDVGCDHHYSRLRALSLHCGVDTATNTRD